jgi:hypothetical protein
MGIGRRAYYKGEYIMKTTMNTNKMSNKEIYEVKQDARLNKVNNRIYDGTAELNELQLAKNIEFSKCENPIRMIQRIYNAESKVGFCTVVVTNVATIKVTEDNLDEFKKAIKLFTRKDMIEAKDHIPYRTMWMEGINKFSEFNFDNGNKYVYYVVSKTEIKEFVNRLRNIHPDKFTVADAKQIQEDIAPFARAWQESSIDITKDKSKHFGFGNNFDDIFAHVDVTSTFLKNEKENIVLNFDEVRDAKRKVQDIQFRIILPKDMPKLEDTIGEINLAIKDAAESFYNNYLALDYNMSNFDFYKQFMNNAKEQPELAYFMKNIFDNFVSYYREGSKATKEQTIEMRNAIYTTAKQYGVTGEDVVKMALSVKINNIYRDEATRQITVNNAKVEKLSLGTILALFPNEFYQLRTGKARTEELNICELTIDIEDNARFEFINGETEDGTIMLTDATFTGIAYEKDGALVYDIDAYAYEEVFAIITERTFAEGAHAKNQITDNGEYAASIITMDKEVVLKGKAGNILTIDDKFVATTCIPTTLKGQIVKVNNIHTYTSIKKGVEVQKFFIVLQ